MCFCYSVLYQKTEFTQPQSRPHRAITNLIRAFDIIDLIDDDISDDIRCVKKIFKEHERLSGNGLNAWYVTPHKNAL